MRTNVLKLVMVTAVGALAKLVAAAGAEIAASAKEAKTAAVTGPTACTKTKVAVQRLGTTRLPPRAT